VTDGSLKGLILWKKKDSKGKGEGASRKGGCTIHPSGRRTKLPSIKEGGKFGSLGKGSDIVLTQRKGDTTDKRGRGSFGGTRIPEEPNLDLVFATSSGAGGRSGTTLSKRQ